jgi:hypothetical protein
MGTFSLASLMVGQTVARVLADDPLPAHPLTQPLDNTTFEPAWTLMREQRRIDLSMSLTFLVGIVQVCLTLIFQGRVPTLLTLFQLLFAVLRLSFITAYLSDQLVAGFTAGAAIHVGTSQISSVLNVKNPKYGGHFALYYIYRDLIISIFAGEVLWIFLTKLDFFRKNNNKISRSGKLHNSRDVAVHSNRNDHWQGGDQSTRHAKTQGRADSIRAHRRRNRDDHFVSNR